MSFATQADGGDLRKRVDELQTRLEYLEAVVLEDEAEPSRPSVEHAEASLVTEIETSADIAAATDTPADLAPTSAVTPTREPKPEPKDLRKLQAEAFADIPFATPAAEPKPTAPAFDIRDIEERLAGRALAIVGGTALLLGAVFFLSLAFSRGWISPAMQVMLGLAGGSAGLSVGAFLLFRGERVVGQVLTAVGLAVVSLSLFAATSLYELIDPAVALAGVFVASAATTVIAIRSHSQVVAGFGLVAVLAAPPIMGAEPDLTAVVYMAAALVGIAAVSMWQTWPWLPPIAFLLSLPQLYQWIATEPELTLAVPALLAYWAVMAVAAGGEAFRSARHELSITSAPLFMAVGASVIGLSFVALEADAQRAAFLLVLAAAHGLVTAFFAHRRGLLDPFGLLAGAYGIAMAMAAVPLLLDASATSLVWTAEAAALAFFAGRRSHGPALIAAVVVYTLAAATLVYEVLLLSPAVDLFGVTTASATVEGALVAFAFFAAAGAAAMAFVPVRSYRYIVVGTVALVTLPVIYLVLDGAAAVAAWVVVAVVAVGAVRWVTLLPEHHIRWRLGPALRWIQPTEDTATASSGLPLLAGTIAMMLAFGGTVAALFGYYEPAEVPFLDRIGLSALALAGGFVAIGLVLGGSANLRRGLFGAGLTIGILSIVELPQPWYVLTWAALAAYAAAMSREDAGGWLSYRRMAYGALAVLALLALVEAPPTRLVVSADGVYPHAPFISDASLALAVLALALGAVALIGRSRWPARLVAGSAALAAATALYLLSVGVVDVFAGEAYALEYRQWSRLEVLAKEAHVGLSVLWTTAGVVVLGLGLLLRQAQLRIAGLVVLALATVKVFFIDLASLDVAYRVITLIVLGLLLIASAYAWSRMKPPEVTHAG